MVLKQVKDLKTRNQDHNPIVIIGGGAVGLYAARELSKRGREVVVIESGGLVLDSFATGSYASIGKPHEGIRIGRARNLGGTTNLWGGQLVEFQPADFAGRPWVKDSKWPVRHEEISLFYERTYENLGIPKDFQDDKQIFRRVDGAESPFKEGLELFFTRWLKIPSFSVAYAKEIETSENLTVLLNHTVVGFLCLGGKITGVRMVDVDGNEHIVTSDLFILAAGTIEICRLLLHAAATPNWDCPWRNNDNVGAFFQDHLVGRVASLEVIDTRRFFNIFSTIVWSGYRFAPKIRLTNEMLQASRVLNIQGMMFCESSISENLIYLKQFLKAALYSRKISGLGDLAKNLRACGKHLLPLMWKYMVDNRIFIPSTSKVSLVIQSEQSPLRDSRITIDYSVIDKAGLPKVILDWKVGDEELASVREFAIRCDNALRAAGLARLRISEQLTDLQPEFLATLRDNFHHAGGARMGDTEKDGVVDRNLRVFGTSNLFVAGAATFRTTSNANTTFTALAFATRLVDHLTSHLAPGIARDSHENGI